MPLVRARLVPYLAFASVLIAILSWHSFVIDTGAFFWRSAFIGLVIATAGVLLRWQRVGALVVVLVQFALGWCALAIAISVTPLPVTSAQRRHVVDVFDSAATTVLNSPLPLPVGHGGIAPYLVSGAAVAFLLADLLACTLRRAPLAGLVLLAVFSVPLSLVENGVDWWLFALTVAAFLSMLGTQESVRLAHWGRRLDDHAGAGIVAENAPGRAPAMPGPGTIGVVATALALVVPVFVPTLNLDISKFGPGGGGHGPIQVTNPMVGMYDDLRSQSDTPLVVVRATGGTRETPSYLRIATLTSFNGSEWTTGGRKIPADHTSRASFDPPEGDRTLLGPSTTYTLTATEDFQSHWLPTFVYTTHIDANGDWRYDDSTLDFIAAGDQSTAGMSWTATSAPVDPGAKRLLSVPAGSAGVSNDYLSLPNLPRQFAEIARQRTAGESSPFAKAVALQNWFHYTGGFTYSLNRPLGTGSDDLLHFVTDQKIGFCQQFATAMAAMARELGIPARVAVGFAHPEQESDGDWVFRARDLHAWPELWFEGIGWVRFEPTPSPQTNSVPSYTDLSRAGTGIGAVPNLGPNPAPAPTQTAKPHDLRDKEPTDLGANPRATARTANHTALIAWLSVLGVLVLLGGLFSAPSSIRRGRRSRRLAGGPEEGWAELRDTAVDLRLPWSDALSPRACAHLLRPSVVTADSRASLDRVVVAVERSRYSRTPSSEPVGADVSTVVDALAVSVDRRVRRWAAFWPRSVFLRRRAVPTSTPPESVERHLVDHI